MVGYRFQKHFFTRFNALIAVEGMVASLRTGRNCIGLGSTPQKLYAQRKVMDRLIEENI